MVQSLELYFLGNDESIIQKMRSVTADLDTLKATIPDYEKLYHHILPSTLLEAMRAYCFARQYLNADLGGIKSQFVPDIHPLELIKRFRKHDTSDQVFKFQGDNQRLDELESVVKKIDIPKNVYQFLDPVIQLLDKIVDPENPQKFYSRSDLSTVQSCIESLENLKKPVSFFYQDKVSMILNITDKEPNLKTLSKTYSSDNRVFSAVIMDSELK